jgi:hypothetical protein
MDIEVKKFVERSIKRGDSLDKIKSTLASYGWEDNMNDAVGYYGEIKKKSPAGTGLKADGASPSTRVATPSLSELRVKSTDDTPPYLRAQEAKFESSAEAIRPQLEQIAETQRRQSLSTNIANQILASQKKATDDESFKDAIAPSVKSYWDEYRKTDSTLPESPFDESGNLSSNVARIIDQDIKGFYDRTIKDEKAKLKREAERTNFIDRAGLGIVEAGLGLADLVSKYATPVPFDAIAGMPTMVSQKAKEARQKRELSAFAERINAGYTEEEINDGFLGQALKGNFGNSIEMLGLDMLDQVPNLVIAAAAGPAGIAFLGTQAGAQDWVANMDNENMSGLGKVAHAFAIGLTESLTERLFSTDINTVRGIGNSLLKGKFGGAKAFSEIPKKELADALFKRVPKALRGSLEEGIEEGIVSVVSQTMDNVMMGKEFSPMDIAESFVLGASMGGGVQTLAYGVSSLPETRLFSDGYKIKNKVQQISELLKDPSIPESEKSLLSNGLNQYKTQLRQLQDESSNLYKKLSPEDQKRMLELHQDITRQINGHGQLKTAEAKAEAVRLIRQSLAEKAQIEQKYDSTQKQQVPSPVVQGAQPGGVPVQGTSTETPQAGGVLQVPSQQEEKVVEAAKQPNVGFRPTKAKLTSETLPQVLSGLKSYVESIPEETLQKFETTRQSITDGFESVANVISSFAKEGLNVEVEAINTEDEWNKATMDPTTGEPQKLSRGLYYQRGQQGAPSKIVLFAPALLGNTVYHEGIHEIVPQAFGQEGINKVAKALASGIKRDPGLNAKFGNFLSQYEEGDKSEELLAELGSMVAAGDIDIEITKSLATRFMEAVASVLGAVGIKMAPNASQLSEAFLSYSQKLGAGAKLDITSEEAVIDSLSGDAPAGPIGEPQLIRKPPKAQKVIQAKSEYPLSNVNNKNVIDIDKLIDDIIANDSKVMFWSGDQLGVGDYTDPYTGKVYDLQGGPSYMLIPDNLKRNVVWATGGSADAFTKRVKRDNIDYVFIISGSPIGMMFFNKLVNDIWVDRAIEGFSTIDSFKEAFGKINKGKKFEAINQYASWDDLKADLSNKKTFKKAKDAIKGIAELSTKSAIPFLTEYGLGIANFDGIRDGYFKENDFNLLDVTTIYKPTGGLKGESNHRTYANAIVGEAVGIPNRRVSAKDIMTQEFLSAKTKKGLTRESLKDSQLAKAIAGETGMIQGVSRPKAQRITEASEELVKLFKNDKTPLTVNEAAEILKHVSSWKDWYDGISGLIEDEFDEYSADFMVFLFSSAVAANSASTVGTAMNNLDKLYNDIEIGSLPLVRKNYFQYILSRIVSSPKISEFIKAGFGDKKAKAIDMHVWSFMNSLPDTESPSSIKQFDKAKEFIDNVAEVLDWQPREVQAAMWAANMLRLGQKPDTYEEYIKKRLDKDYRKTIDGWRKKGIKPIFKVNKVGEIIEVEYAREIDRPYFEKELAKAEGQISARKAPKRQALESYNEKDKPLPGQRLFNEPLKEASKIADDYYKKEFGEERPKFDGVKSVNKERAKLISDAYSAMKDNYKDPLVKKAYDAMIKETLKQFDAIIDNGYSVVMSNNDRYNNSEEMIKDLRDNKQMLILSTEAEFGDNPITEKQRQSNPLLNDSGRKDSDGIPLLNNDVFRFVHDFFGHAELGNSFGAIGEENAWNVHARMYSPLARRAMTTETRGQNSYVNFSGVNEEVFKIRDKAREERKKGNIEEADRLKMEVDEKMKFADQKVGLLPEWVSKTDEELPENRTDIKQSAPTKKAMLQIIGSNSQMKEWTSKMLLKANEMDRRGVKPKTIFNVTGWERGADKKWRYPVPTFKLNYTKVAEFNEGPVGNTVSLYDLVENKGRFKEDTSKFGYNRYEYDDKGKTRTKENEDVFDFYPEFANMKVTLGPSNGSTFFKHTKSAGSKALGEITMSKDWYNKSPDHFFFVLVHEIQHAVQREEGFAVGGSASTVDNEIDEVIKANERILKNKDKIVPALKENIKEQKERIKWYIDQGYSQETMIKDGVLTTLDGLETQVRMIDDVEKQLNFLKQIKAATNLSSVEKYRILSGEVEADNAARRAAFQLAKGSLATQPLIETEEIPREYQLIITPDIEDMSLPSFLTKMGYPSKPKRQGISKAQGPLIPIVYNSLLQQSTRNADGTNTPPYTLQEWLTMMTPYLNAQTATAIYNGVARNKPPFTAPSIQDAYDSSKKRMEAGKNKALFTWNNLKKYFIDRQAELKKAILASGMKNAYNYLVNKAGSGARAAYFYYEKEKDIYKDLKKEQIEKLDQIIMLRRIIEIDSNFDERGEARPKHTNGFNKGYAEMELARLQKELGNAAYNDLNDRATKYFDAFRSLLDSMYEEGLVSEELYEQLRDIDYQPRLFLDHVFEMDEPSMREMNLSAAQIKRIKEGSEGDIMFDSRFLLALYAKSAFSKIARNKANKEIAKATDAQGNESWVSKTDKPSFSEVTYFEDGVRKSFYLKDNLKSELDDISRVSGMPQNIQKLIGMVTGSFAVKLLATRANPLFVAKNVPRDYLHVLFFTKAYDNMSLPLAAMRLAGDFIKGVKSKLQDDQDFKDFVEFGGGMDFLSTEGMESMITNRTVTNKIIEKLGKAGELSEIGFRLAMYKKFKEDGMKALGPNATEDEVTRVKVQAVTQAREMIDFSQGGIATKNLEIVSPYINSAFQGFRVSTSYIQNNPKEFAKKLGYLSIGVMMLALYNAMLGDDDMEDIPEETKRKYFIIMTPFTFEEDGKTKRHYIKIAKTQQLAPFIAGLELASDYFVAEVMGRKPRESKDAYEYAWKGATMYFPKDPSNIKKEISSSVPLFAAIAAYDMNYDTYRERAVSMDYNQVLPQDEDFTNKQVPYFYKALAQGIGASGGEAGPKRLQVATEKFVTTPYSSLLTMGAYTILDSFSRLFELKGPGGIPVKDQAAISNSVSKSLGLSASKVFTGATEPDWRSYTRKEEIERINMEEKSERRGIKIAAQNIGQKYFEAYNAKDSKAMSAAKSEYQDELMKIKKESGAPDAKYFMDAFQQARKYGKATNPEYNDISYAANNEAKLRIIMEYVGRTMSRKELIEYISDYKRKTGKSINGAEILREYQKETGYGK